MTSLQPHRQRTSKFTLERAILVAVVLHLLFGAATTWWPGLLRPAELMAQPDREPLEFRFVDTPETEPPPETPDTEVLSDIDRQAADLSERDDQPTPFSEGNTPQPVVRPAAVPVEAVETPAVTPQPEAAEPQPEAAEEPADPADPTETNAEEVTSEEPTETAETSAEPQPVTAASLPPRPRSLRQSLARLDSYVDPQINDNRQGGVDGPQSLAQFDTKGYDLGAYLNDVLRTIERNWRASMPPLIQTGVGGATFIALSIRRQRDANGNEVAVLVAERMWTSGQPAYDSAAQFSLELSNPLPAIPDYYPYDVISGRLGYIYNLDPAQVVFPDQN